jgi:hypothetical protein
MLSSKKSHHVWFGTSGGCLVVVVMVHGYAMSQLGQGRADPSTTLDASNAI